MRTSLTLLASAALLATLGACNRQPAAPGGVSPEDDQALDNASNMTLFDTSPDDASANVEDVVEENAVETPPTGNGAGNRQ